MPTPAADASPDGNLVDRLFLAVLAVLMFLHRLKNAQIFSSEAIAALVTREIWVGFTFAAVAGFSGNFALSVSGTGDIKLGIFIFRSLTYSSSSSKTTVVNSEAIRVCGVVVTAEFLGTGKIVGVTDSSGVSASEERMMKMNQIKSTLILLWVKGLS